MATHSVDEGVVVQLNRVRDRLKYALEEYQNAEKSLNQVEANIRQSIHVLRKIRKDILHGGEY